MFKNSTITLQEPIFSNTTTQQCPTILLIDSGMGGISIYNKVRRLLPGAHYLYVFDNEAFPYGEKSEQFIIDRMISIVSAVMCLHKLDLVILACNTASTISLPALRNCFYFPIVGVVPAIKQAANMTRNGIIGLLATYATVQSGYVQSLINQFANNCQILRLGMPELVQLAEKKFYGQTIISLPRLSKLLDPLLSATELPDIIVLGCTHFPLIRQEIQSVLPKNTLLIDSSSAIANRTAWLVAHHLHMRCCIQKKLFKKNKAYYLTITTTRKILAIKLILRRYGFKSFERLTL